MQLLDKSSIVLYSKKKNKYLPVESNIALKISHILIYYLCKYLEFSTIFNSIED